MQAKLKLQNFLAFCKKLSFVKKLSTKQALLILLPLVYFGVFYPVHHADAIIDWLAIAGTIGIGVGISVASKLVGAVVALGFLSIISGYLLKYADAILKWAVTSPFNMSFTNPANNIVIQLGWTLLRDFTNMLFILGLAYIGLATALDFGNKFTTRKTFAFLLLIALLVNFTPVITGAIVDVTNIITHFFVSGVNFGPMVDVVRNNFNIEEGFWDKISIEGLTKYVLGIFYKMLAGGALAIFAFLFLARHIAIWLLVIASPLAFFAFIFDKTRKYFQSWWKWFLGWAIVGIPAGFFLYLGHALVNEISKGKEIVHTAMLETSAPHFGMIVPYVLVTIFLYGAIVVTKKMTPAGASGIMSIGGALSNKTTGFAKKHWGKIKTAAVDVEGGRKRGERIGGEARQRMQAAKVAGKGDWGQRWAGLGGLAAGASGEIARSLTGIKPETKKESLKAARESVALESLDELKQRVDKNKPKSDEYGAAVEKMVKDDNFEYDDEKSQEIIGNMLIHHPRINIRQLAKARPELDYLFKQDKYDAKVEELQRPIAQGGLGIMETHAKEEAKRHFTKERTKTMNSEDVNKIKIDEILDRDPEAAASIVLGMDRGKAKYIGEHGNTKTKKAIMDILQGRTPQGRTAHDYIDLQMGIMEPNEGEMFGNALDGFFEDPNYS